MPERSPVLDTGIYRIVNTVNGKVYVGSAARSLKRRLWRHLTELTTGNHYNEHLQRAWNAYGAEAFQMKVIQYCIPEDCLEREQFWIDFHRAADGLHGYNICPTAGSRQGSVHKESTKKQMSESAKNSYQTRPGNFTGKHHSEETKQKISAANKGQNLGGTLPEETRRKLSKAQTGRKHSLESRIKRGNTRRGYVMSRETKRKISNTKKRHSHLKRLKRDPVNRVEAAPVLTNVTGT